MTKKSVIISDKSSDKDMPPYIILGSGTNESAFESTNYFGEVLIS